MAKQKTIAQASALEPKTKLEGKIVKTTIAGAIVDLGLDLPGVIHISHLQKEPVNKVEDVVQVGQTVEVWVRRAKKDRVELTMIEPLPLEWRELKPTMVVKGKVVRLESYGAFVDIGAERPGLVHISEMARGYIKTPGDVVKEGDEVEALVLDVNRRKKQIRLSLKALQPAAEVTPAPSEAKRKHSKRSGRKQEVVEETSSEPEMTSMEMAWQQALERAKENDREHKDKPARSSGTSEEQEDILSRTLEKRLPTGG
jgi:small subunit ribosomal protein S1